jgi:nucleoid-associated protein YgaU
VSKSRRIILLAAGILTLAMLACATSSPTPLAPAPTQTIAPSATQAGSQATPTLASAGFPTVTPISSSTLAPMPTESPTATASASKPVNTPVATKPTGPAPKLDFTLGDIEYAYSLKRKPDDKIQLTIRLLPKGGLPPYRFVLDPGPFTSQPGAQATPEIIGGTWVNGLTYTFNWHNCNENEPHSIILFSADGQWSKTVAFQTEYRCD